MSEPSQTTTEERLPTLAEIYDLYERDPSGTNPRRPPNQYMLYRKYKHQGASSKSETEISKQTGKDWKAAKAEVREHFERLAYQLREEHRKRYPNFQYRPPRMAQHEVDAGTTRSTTEQHDRRFNPYPNRNLGVSELSGNEWDQSLMGTRSDGRDLAGGLMSTYSSLANVFGSNDAPVYDGPVLATSHSGFGPGSFVQGNVDLTNSAQAFENQPALEPYYFETPSHVPEFAPNVSAYNPDQWPNNYGNQASTNEFADPTHWNEMAGYQDMQDYHYNPQAGPTWTGMAGYPAAQDYYYNPEAGPAWNGMAGHQAVQDYHYNPQAGPSMYRAPVEDTYLPANPEDEWALYQRDRYNNQGF